MSAQEEVRVERPPFDTVAFVFGSLFVLVAVLGLLGPAITSRLDLGVILPLALVTIGIALLAGTVRPRRSGPPTP
jgi:heme/copper-type cytochrome/quinol oxidase subunit 4